VALVLAGGLAGLAGVLFTSLAGPSLSFGSTLLLPAFAAAFLGSTQIQVARFNVWGTLIAIYALATGVEGFQLVSGEQWLSDMFNGVAVIGAVALAVNRQRRSMMAGRREAWRRAQSPAQRADGGEATSVGGDEATGTQRDLAGDSVRH
jgi:ribose transport system permease protein